MVNKRFLLREVELELFGKITYLEQITCKNSRHTWAPAHIQCTHINIYSNQEIQLLDCEHSIWISSIHCFSVYPGECLWWSSSFSLPPVCVMRVPAHPIPPPQVGHLAGPHHGLPRCVGGGHHYSVSWRLDSVGEDVSCQPARLAEAEREGLARREVQWRKPLGQGFE